MPHTYTKQELEERYKKLPEPLKDAMFSPDVAEKMFEIGKKNGLTIEKTGFMAEETGFIILGLTVPREFVGILSDRLEIDKDAAARIASDINHVILFPLREALKNAHNMEVGEAELQKEEIVIKKPTPPAPAPVVIPANPQPRTQPVPKSSPAIPPPARAGQPPSRAGGMQAGQPAPQTKNIVDLRSLLSTPELPAAKPSPDVSASTPVPAQTPRPAPAPAPAIVPQKIQQAAPIPEKLASLPPEKATAPTPAPQPIIPKPPAPPAAQTPVPERPLVPPPPIVIPPNPKPESQPLQNMPQNPKNPPIDLRPAPQPAPAPVIPPAPVQSSPTKTYEGYDPYREPIE